jgi:hypothetical protein
MAGGCSSSEYKEGYNAGYEAIRLGLEKTAPAQEQVIPEDAPIEEPVVNPEQRSEQWTKGFNDGIRDAQRKLLRPKS